MRGINHVIVTNTYRFSGVKIFADYTEMEIFDTCKFIEHGAFTHLNCQYLFLNFQ